MRREIMHLKRVKKGTWKSFDRKGQWRNDKIIIISKNNISGVNKG